MRGDIVYRVYGCHEGRDKDVFFGAYRTTAEARARAAELVASPMDGGAWAQKYHNKGFAIREAVVETDFVIPSRPKPREKYFVKTTKRPNRPGTWDSTIVDVFRRAAEPEKICDYLRHYSMLQTFEPFRQGDRELALISCDYTKTAVLDLATGTVIAEEADAPGAPRGGGFCPVGFYVPDWWDLNDGSVIPGSEYWNADKEWPVGDFGFVWGCHWGDDSSWKVQYLDLSQVQQGIVRRDSRFGYIELATIGYQSPCLIADSTAAINSRPPPFIRVANWSGKPSVTFAVEMQLDLATGRSDEWQRLKVANSE